MVRITFGSHRHHRFDRRDGAVCSPRCQRLGTGDPRASIPLARHHPPTLTGSHSPAMFPTSDVPARHQDRYARVPFAVWDAPTATLICRAVNPCRPARTLRYCLRDALGLYRCRRRGVCDPGDPRSGRGRQLAIASHPTGHPARIPACLRPSASPPTQPGSRASRLADGHRTACPSR